MNLWNDTKERDKRIVINHIVAKMLLQGSKGGIELDFNRFLNIHLTKDEILEIIKKMRYDGFYDENKKVFKIWKIPHIFDPLGDRDFLYHYIDELKDDEYFKQYDRKYLDLSALQLYSNEIAEMIKEAGYKWYFEDIKKVWIL